MKKAERRLPLEDLDGFVAKKAEKRRIALEAAEGDVVRTLLLIGELQMKVDRGAVLRTVEEIRLQRLTKLAEIQKKCVARLKKPITITAVT